MASTSLLTHCQTMYTAMDDAAVDKTEGRMFEGSLSGLFNDKGPGQAYYPQVMTRLKKMGCVELIRRGGGNVPSQWLLRTFPTEELNDKVNRDRTKDSAAPAREALDQRQRDLHRRLSALETWARNQGAPI